MSDPDDVVFETYRHGVIGNGADASSPMLSPEDEALARAREPWERFDAARRELAWELIRAARVDRVVETLARWLKAIP